jgi:hypothetical protein
MVNQGSVKSTIDLSLLMLGQLELFTIILLFLTRCKGVNKYLIGNASRNEKFAFSVVFGIFGILATYMGVPVGGAIVNSRVVWVVLGGILGGPQVGLFAGIIAGAHRFLTNTGGLTTHACGIATVVEGFLGGILYYYIKRKKFDAMAALVTGITMEVLHMLIILAIAKPFDDAFHHVKLIAIPMIAVNAVGIALFVEMLSLVTQEQERYASKEAQKVVDSVSPLQRVVLYKNGTSFYIPPEKIVYFKCQYGEILGYTGDDTYEAKLTMYELENKLVNNRFFRTHRSYLVNLYHIDEDKRWVHDSYLLTMDDKEKTKVPVSRYKVRDYLTAISEVRQNHSSS